MNSQEKQSQEQPGQTVTGTARRNSHRNSKEKQSQEQPGDTVTGRARRNSHRNSQ